MLICFEEVCAMKFRLDESISYWSGYCEYHFVCLRFKVGVFFVRFAACVSCGLRSGYFWVYLQDVGWTRAWTSHIILNTIELVSRVIKSMRFFFVFRTFLTVDPSTYLFGLVWLAGSQAVRLTDILVGLIGWLAGWMVGGFIDWLAGSSVELAIHFEYFDPPSR